MFEVKTTIMTKPMVGDEYSEPQIDSRTVCIGTASLNLCTGDRPIPAAGNRFPDRATARAAARATEQYRSALRRYDPQVPYYDLIVCEETSRDATIVQPQETATETPKHSLSEPAIADSTTPERRDLVEFCHRVAGAVFETLSEGGYDGIESGVMDAYFQHAETVGDPDELCLCLLESMTSELHERLSPADQAKVLTDAAARLESPSDDDSALDASLTTLEQRGLIESYTRSPYSVDLDGGAGAVVVQISGYALSAHEDRLPVLPLTLELCRHHTEQSPQSVQVAAVDDGWQLTFGLADTGDQNGLVSAPIDGEA
ncbi:hypothetical protein [Halorubrum sp. CSM-61]|uniref:DUF7551 domain-containing protein n=1 Tax=Halorubrum sp. CSM-61 TaxID=2485838 RepID=UPI001F1546A8|nr:hypothetical protein [Halorubrum sp. CSM-61]